MNDPVVISLTKSIRILLATLTIITVMFLVASILQQNRIKNLEFQLAKKESKSFQAGEDSVLYIGKKITFRIESSEPFRIMVK